MSGCFVIIVLSLRNWMNISAKSPHAAGSKFYFIVKKCSQILGSAMGYFHPLGIGSVLVGAGLAV